MSKLIDDILIACENDNSCDCGNAYMYDFIDGLKTLKIEIERLTNIESDYKSTREIAMESLETMRTIGKFFNTEFSSWDGMKATIEDNIWERDAKIKSLEIKIINLWRIK